MTDAQQAPPCELKDEDGFLYHYTDLNALIGIIDKRVLWATHIRYLNDTTEQQIMRRLASERAERFVSMTSSRALPARFTGVPFDLLANRDSSPETSRPIFYVICFSEDHGDRLSQWRAYGGSAGVCLKLHKAALNEYLNGRHSSLHQAKLVKVQYSPQEGNAAINETINYLIAAYDNLGEGLPALLSMIGAEWKDEAFQEEKEWRILLSEPIELALGRGAFPLKHRSRGSLLVPYIDFEFSDKLESLLVEVIVGPSNHRDQTTSAIRGLLDSHSFFGTEVTCSKIPYRGF